jgi:hypothetical protein
VARFEIESRGTQQRSEKITSFLTISGLASLSVMPGFYQNDNFSPGATRHEIRSPAHRRIDQTYGADVHRSRTGFLLDNEKLDLGLGYELVQPNPYALLLSEGAVYFLAEVFQETL